VSAPQRLAIAGAGERHASLTDTGTSQRMLLRDAVDSALAASGVSRPQVDGWITAMGPLDDLRFLGLAPRFATAVDSGGSSPATALITAFGALQAGLASVVVCAFSSRVAARSGSIGEVAHRYPPLWGMSGAVTAHALFAQRYLQRFGGTPKDLGEVAVAQREHARVRQDASYFGRPLALEEYLDSPLVAEPLRRLDCCRDANVGAAVVVTTPEIAADLPAAPVYVAGIGAGDNIRNWHAGTVFDHHDDVEDAKARAFAQAGVSLSDVDSAQLYDPFTISVLMQLEHYGFCGPGEAADYVRGGALGLGGALPTNTGGGQLSGRYAIGFTPILEAVRQLRGEAGPTQVSGAHTVLVSNHGGSSGVPNTYHHLTMVLTDW